MSTDLLSCLKTALLAGGLLAVAAGSPAHEGPRAPVSYVSTGLAVTGAVVSPKFFSVADLEGLPLQQVAEVDIVCASGVKVGRKENLRGVLLRDIIEEAQLKALTPRDFRKMAVIAKATDRYAVAFSWGELFNSAAGDHVIVYFHKDGGPLGDEEGRIALISTQDTLTGPRHVRWLNEIEVRQLVP